MSGYNFLQCAAEIIFLAHFKSFLGVKLFFNLFVIYSVTHIVRQSVFQHIIVESLYDLKTSTFDPFFLSVFSLLLKRIGTGGMELSVIKCQ